MVELHVEKQTAIIPSKQPKLSEELAMLQQRYEKVPVKLRELIAVLRGRAYLLLVFLLALPFITPIPLPGLSTPFGAAIALIALRMVLGQKPWLPEKILAKEIPSGFFGKLLGFTRRAIGLVETFIRPRWSLFFTTPGVIRLHSLLIFVAALALLLPLPIPFTNSFPAWSILLMACALLERDGLFVVLSYLVFALGVLYFFLLGEAAERALKSLLAWLSS